MYSDSFYLRLAKWVSHEVLRVWASVFEYNFPITFHLGISFCACKSRLQVYLVVAPSFLDLTSTLNYPASNFLTNSPTRLASAKPFEQ
ncbi:hypothetical protein BC827DRAFT_249031 [Russula dissimulans]|nr:hypothetical protein BC827DRAFT_249031 [Russula dissimulans]